MEKWSSFWYVKTNSRKTKYLFGLFYELNERRDKNTQHISVIVSENDSNIEKNIVEKKPIKYSNPIKYSPMGV